MALVNGLHTRILSELRSAAARIQLVQFTYPEPRKSVFRQEECYWLDLCLTPRRAGDTARYVDHWVGHRHARMGAIALLLPGETLEIANTGGRRISLLCQIDVAVIRDLLPRKFAMTDRRMEACLDISDLEISRQMRRLAEELRDHGLGWERACAAIVEQLVIDLARYLTGVAETDSRGTLAAWRLGIIDRRAQMAGPLPRLRDMAAECNLSTRHLTRAFRLTRGCTIGEYLAQSRIETAKRRLATADSVKVIAESLGFSSQANFSTAFRRATGVSPNDFRKRMLRGGERGVDG